MKAGGVAPGISALGCAGHGEGARHEGYQGGSEGIALNTAPTGGAWVRGEGDPRASGYDRAFSSGGRDRGPGPGTGGYDRDVRGAGRGPWTRGGGMRGSFDQGDQGYAGGGGEYDPRYARGRRPGAGYDRGYGRG